MLWRRLAIAFVSIVPTLPAQAVFAQTDEIQVYNGEIDEVGQASLTLHNNYTPIGRKEAEFPGGIVPQGSYNGVAEWAYGVTGWLEAGLYLPLYSITREGRPSSTAARSASFSPSRMSPSINFST